MRRFLNYLRRNFKMAGAVAALMVFATLAIADAFFTGPIRPISVDSRTLALWDSAGTYKMTITAPTLAADRAMAFPDFGASTALIPSTLTTNAPDVANSIWGVSNGLRMEGSVANDYEGTLSPGSMGADVTWTLPPTTGAVLTSTLTTNDPEAANSVWGASNAIAFEGATADAFEITIAPTDPTTPDKVVTLPDQTGAVILSVGGVAEAANAISGGTGTFIFEGDTADAFETSLAVTDPTTPDKVVTLPDQTGAVILSPGGVAEAANAISGGTGTLIAEGATADAHETIIAFGDPTVGDATITVPNSAGVSSDFVLTTLAQTLTNKTLSGAINTDYKVLAASATYDNEGAPQALTGFTWTVAAGGTYDFQIDLDTTMTTNGGLELAFTLTTATLTSIRYTTYAATASDNTTAVSSTGTTTASATKMFDSKTAAYTTVRVKGSFVVGTGGTFALTACQETAAAGGDATLVLIGSTARVTRAL